MIPYFFKTGWLVITCLFIVTWANAQDKDKRIDSLTKTSQQLNKMYGLNYEQLKKIEEVNNSFWGEYEKLNYSKADEEEKQRSFKKIATQRDEGLQKIMGADTWKKYQEHLLQRRKESEERMKAQKLHISKQ